jgi:hypothetical protein
MSIEEGTLMISPMFRTQYWDAFADLHGISIGMLQVFACDRE